MHTSEQGQKLVQAHAECILNSARRHASIDRPGKKEARGKLRGSSGLRRDRGTGNVGLWATKDKSEDRHTKDRLDLEELRKSF